MTNDINIKVEKRGGRGLEPLNIEKIHEMVEYACEDIKGVSASQVEMSSGLQFYDGITTNDIQQILIKSASDLISLDNPNYQYVAARLLLFSLRKQVIGRLWDHPNIYDHVEKCVKLGVYDPDILKKYARKDFSRMQNWITHERDNNFTYAGLRQVIDKYLVQDRSSGEIYETPQFMYMMIAATLFQNYDKARRMTYVKKYYDSISNFKINIPTPVMAGVRTPIKQYASCVLVDTDDTLPSIFSSDMAIGNYVAQRAGIGINAGRIRGINARIRGGEVQHTGVIPFLKKFEATVKCCTQNGVRGGSATVHFPIWHQEIEDIIVLKHNKGTEDNRVRKLDYSIQISKLFYERFINEEQITLFSPHEVPELYEAWGTPEFDELYLKAERKLSVNKKKINAQDLFFDLLKERAETGRTTPIQHIDGPGEIALCILSAINVGKINNLDELEELCDLTVRALEEIIDHQKYPVKAAEISTKARRSLGVGYIGLAHYLAKTGYKYEQKGAWKEVDKLSEAFQYYLLKSSNEIAKEKGQCDLFYRTKYADGILPIDTYKKEVDELVTRKLSMKWDKLRADIKEFGLRHSTLSAQMPSESSSVVSNATNGIEPPRDHLSVKKSKKGTLKQIVPEYNKLKNFYTLLWDMPSNEGYINIVAVMQKYFDQAISGNWSYNPDNYEDNQVPVSVMAQDLLTTYKYGWKTSYYQNTYDSKKDIEEPKHSIDYDTPITTETPQEDEENCDSCTI